MNVLQQHNFFIFRKAAFCGARVAFSSLTPCFFQFQSGPCNRPLGYVRASLTYYVVVFTGITFSCIPELEYVATDARKIDDVSMDESNEELGLELREQIVDKLDIETIC